MGITGLASDLNSHTSTNARIAIGSARTGAYLLAARRLSVRSGGFGDVLQGKPTEDRDDGIREAECEGGEGCRLAAGRLQGGLSVRQEACAPGLVAGSGVASRAKYTSKVKVS
jgi:hypothetical protein